MSQLQTKARSDPDTQTILSNGALQGASAQATLDLVYDQLEQALKDNDKPYEFHSFEGAGHAFFSVDRPSYRVEAANEGWEYIFRFFGTNLG